MIVFQIIMAFICLLLFIYNLLVFLPVMRVCQCYKMRMSKFGFFLQAFNILWNLILFFIILSL